MLDGYKLWVYDFEVFAHDWLVVIKDCDSQEHTHFWNDDADDYLAFMDAHSSDLFVSYNGAHYDKWIAKSIKAGCTPEEVKEINDFIIGGSDTPVWEHPYLKSIFWDFYDVDLMKDTQAGTSLKSIEGHMGMSIEESSVDFTVTHKLSALERAEVLHYCIHDVDATYELLQARADYLETKLHLGERAGLDPARALALTNAKLTAKVLGAEFAPHDDERAYVYPDNLDRDLIPPDVLDFFDRVSDESIPDAELWSSKLEIDVGGCPVTLGFGGIHGARPKRRVEASSELEVLNVDVSSYYPSLMVVNGYTSRNMRSPKVFEDIYHERLAAKKAGDKATANALKLVVNTTYGATLDKFNDLYDPLMGRSVCISGQLYLLELARRLVRDVETLTLEQLNTDGVLVSYAPRDAQSVKSICAEWEKRTGFELEYDPIALIWQRDVNNYAMRLTDGTEKLKGGRLVRGASKAGAYSINNNAPIVARALKDYLLDGRAVEDTVRACDDPAEFQMIAKASGKYSRVYQIENLQEVERQRCNRVFASLDDRDSTLYKVKRDNGQVAKMTGLPERCFICNTGFPDIALIDKEWYVALAQKWAQEFKEENHMATEKPKATDIPVGAITALPDNVSVAPLNVYQKLSRARKLFSERAGAASGINADQGWSFVELIDIVPLQTPIFDELGLLEEFTCQLVSTAQPQEAQDWFDTETGAMTSRTIKYGEPMLVGRSIVRNTDKPDETIEFTLPWRDIEPIISKSTGKAVDNALQREGKEQTYLRRYLKMQILDIALPDEIDKGASQPSETTPKPQSHTSKPATPTERKETAQALTDPDAPASQLQIRQLKKSIKTLKEAYPDDTEAAALIADISVSTNDLTEVSKRVAEEKIRELGDLKARLDSKE